MKIRSLIGENSVFKDLSVLIIGTVLAQMIPILLQPILKRLFTPEEFGIYEIYFRIVGIFSVLFTLRYEKAIVLTRRKIDAYGLLYGVCIISTTLGIISILVIAFLDNALGILADIPSKYRIFFYFAPVSAFFFAGNNLMQAFFIRERNFGKIAVLKILRRLSEGGVQSFFGLFNGSIGLFIGEMIGNMFAGLIGLKTIRNGHKGLLPDNILRYVAKKNMSRYIDFPKYTLLSNLANTFVVSALSFQVYSKFSIEEVGYLELTQKILMVPIAIIGISVGQLILQRASDQHNKKGKVRPLFVTFLSMNLIFAVPFFLVLYFFGEQLFSWIFGEVWKNSGIFAKILVPSSTMMFIVSPLGQFLIGIKKIKLNSFWEFLKFFSVLSLFFVKFENIIDYLYTYNVIIFSVYTVYIFIIIRHVLIYDRNINTSVPLKRRRY